MIFGRTLKIERGGGFPMKCWYSSIELHDVTSQNTVVLADSNQDSQPPGGDLKLEPHG
jgi:hypothetical protein